MSKKNQTVNNKKKILTQKNVVLAAVEDDRAGPPEGHGTQTDPDAHQHREDEALRLLLRHTLTPPAHGRSQGRNQS